MDLTVNTFSPENNSTICNSVYGGRTNNFRSVYESHPLCYGKLKGKDKAEELLHRFIDLSIANNGSFFHTTYDHLSSEIHRTKRSLTRLTGLLKRLGYITIEPTTISDGKTIRTHNYYRVNFDVIYADFGDKLFQDRMPKAICSIKNFLKYVGKMISLWGTCWPSKKTLAGMPSKIELEEESKIPIHKFRSAHLFIEDRSAPSNISIQEDKFNLFSETGEDPAPESVPEHHDSKFYQEGKYPLSDKYRNIAGQTGLSSDYHDSLYLIYDANQHGKVVKNGIIAWRIYCENKFHGFYGARNALPEAARERIKAYSMFPQATTDEQALALYQSHKQSSVQGVPRDLFREISEDVRPLYEALHAKMGDANYASWVVSPKAVIIKHPQPWNQYLYLCRFPNAWYKSTVNTRFGAIFDTLKIDIT